ncbi:thioesterase family protein [Tamaricihabitans halophyticus]|nr:thioesterase family protein [Tamaricihabitans halophyticus]
MTTTTSEFDADTEVEQLSEDHYRARLSERWCNPTGATNGGYLLGVCLRALQARLPFPDPLAVSAFYLRPGLPGSAELNTELVRAGRRMATGEVRLAQGGKEVIRVVSTFSELTERPDGKELGSMPQLPPPEECPAQPDAARAPETTMAGRIEYRYPSLPGWMSGNPSGRSTDAFWMRFADGRDADPLSLPSLVDSAAPVIFDLGMPGSSTVELTAHLRARPAPGWLACKVSTQHMTGGYHEEDFEIWDSTGVLVAQSRQLAIFLE